MNKKVIITDKDLKKVGYRWLFTNTSAWNWERMQHLAFSWSIMPVLKKLYPEKKDFSAALERHMKFFNTEPTVGAPVILGTVIALEQSKSEGEDIDEEMIDAIKSGLMGPLAAIGDSLFASTINALLLSIAMGFALDGNIMGPILFAATWTVLNLLLVTRGTVLGYRQGVNIIDSPLFSDTFMKKLTNAFTILGLTVIGGLSASFITLQTKINWGIKEQSTLLQDVLDGLMPKLLPFVFVLVLWYLHDKKQISIMKLLLFIIIFGIAISLIGFFFVQIGLYNV